MSQLSRLDVTEKIIATKVAKGMKWADGRQGRPQQGVGHRRLPGPDDARQEAG